MKFSVLFVLAALLTVAARADVDSRATKQLGIRNVYVRVVLEKRNGIDMRANVMPQQFIDKLEKEGKVVRPSRTSANVGYWAFLKEGDFATCEVYNNPSMANLGYGDLEKIFASAPRAGTRWKLGDALEIGGREYSIRILDKNDAVTGGQKSEVEMAVLKNGKKVYYYFGALLEHG